MRLKPLLVFAAAGMVVWAAWPSDADAQTRRRQRAVQVTEAYPGAGYAYTRAGRVRVTVTNEGRSFLDPGTTVQPRSRSYTDYANPPLWSADRNFDTTLSYRSPLPFNRPNYVTY